jgi:hypothetical protein
LPPTLRKNLELARAVIAKTDQYRDRAEQARQRYEVVEPPPAPPSLPAPLEINQEKPSGVDFPQATPPFLTATLMRKMNDDFGEFKRVEEEANSLDALTEELVKTVFKKMEPVKMIKEGVSFRVLNEHYPVFGEILSTVASAFNDWAFERVRSQVAQSVLYQKATNPQLSFQTIIDQQASKGASAAPLQWSFYSEGWSIETNRALAVYAEGVETSKGKLVRISKQRQIEVLNARERDLGTRIGKLRRVGVALHDGGLVEVAARISTALDLLIKENENWPALGPLSEAQSQALSKIMRPVEESWASQRSTSNRAYPSHEFPSYSEIMVGDPLLAATNSLVDYAHEHLLLAVESSLDRPNEIVVERALGSGEFDELKSTHDGRVAEEVRRQAAIREEQIKREQEIARQKAWREEIRRQEIERREYEHRQRYEHPVVE